MTLLCIQYATRAYTNAINSTVVTHASYLSFVDLELFSEHDQRLASTETFASTRYVSLYLLDGSSSVRVEQYRNSLAGRGWVIVVLGGASAGGGDGGGGAIDT